MIKYLKPGNKIGQLHTANCGKFIDSDNIELLAGSLEEFSNMDKMRLNEMGMNGKEYLNNNLNHETPTKEYLNSIDSL